MRVQVAEVVKRIEGCNSEDCVVEWSSSSDSLCRRVVVGEWSRPSDEKGRSPRRQQFQPSPRMRTPHGPSITHESRFTDLGPENPYRTGPVDSVRTESEPLLDERKVDGTPQRLRETSSSNSSRLNGEHRGLMSSAVHLPVRLFTVMENAIFSQI